MAKADNQKFTDKQRAFIANYLRCFNATDAAKRAGYSARTANEQGSRLLANASIRAEIDRILNERMMGAQEVLDRMSDIGRADVADLMAVSDRGFSLDMSAAKALGLTKLIKRVKQKTTIYHEKGGDDREETILEVELYDAQSALVTMGKQHGLFTTKVELRDLTAKNDSELVTEFEQLLDTARARAGNSDSAGTQEAGSSQSESNGG